jgi:hypothetical protein
VLLCDLCHGKSIYGMLWMAVGCRDSSECTQSECVDTARSLQQYGIGWQMHSNSRIAAVLCLFAAQNQAVQQAASTVSSNDSSSPAELVT